VSGVLLISPPVVDVSINNSVNMIAA